MIVRHWMTTKLVTIRKEASIQEALSVMKQGSIRHLPVVDEEDLLIGWVTDADLRGVLIASMLEELTLEDVMIRKPYVADPDMSLENAALLILNKRIGGLPVVEEGKPIGVITVVDLMSAFINMLGLLSQSSRLDVEVSATESPLDEVTRLIRRHKAEVISICHVPTAAEGDFVYSFRLKKCDLEPIVKDLEGSGVKVLSSIA